MTQHAELTKERQEQQEASAEGARHND
jgi:hypothetical protein